MHRSRRASINWPIFRDVLSRQNFVTKDTPLSATEFSNRIISLEMAVAHLERELEQMHSVLLAVQADLKLSREQVSKLERRVTLANEAPEERDPIDERPPHY